MTQRGETRTRSRRGLRPTAVGLLVVATAVIGTLVHQSVASTPSVVDGAVDAVDAADGVLPDGVTVFDDRYPGVADLDPDLLRALREAATEAADDGVTFYVNSGWRSRGYQNELLSVAVSTYGSESAAARWVATADTSPHVSGEAVDIGKDEATAWLSSHGGEARTVPDLRQRTLALRAAPRGEGGKLPADVCRPHPRPEDAAVTIAH